MLRRRSFIVVVQLVLPLIFDLFDIRGDRVAVVDALFPPCLLCFGDRLVGAEVALVGAVLQFVTRESTKAADSAEQKRGFIHVAVFLLACFVLVGTVGLMLFPLVSL